MNTESKKITFSFAVSMGLILASFIVGQPDPPQAAGQIKTHVQRKVIPAVSLFQDERLENKDEPIVIYLPQTSQELPVFESSAYAFHNPAGCAPAAPADLSPQARLENVQLEIAGRLDLEDRHINYIWHGPSGSFIDIADDPYVYEFQINEFQPPFTYRADLIIASFVQNGFAVWLRSYAGDTRLLAVALSIGAVESLWIDYIEKYWQQDGIPEDEWIIPVTKKIPCQWMIDVDYVSNEAVESTFTLDWQIPDYLSAGRQYLAQSCSRAYRVSQEELGYWDATSVCGPLTWQITHDAEGFPYRIGNYDANSDLFINANPKYWGRRPWIGFDPETYDLIRVDQAMAGFDFQSIGELNSGDIIFSYGSPNQWDLGGGYFAHIFMVAGLDGENSRLAVTNMVKNQLGVEDCNISEVVLYTPGDQGSGVINYEWNDHGYGTTGRYGFDVFRWKWISYHLEGEEREYQVRRGDTIETIAFDWKVSPQEILGANELLNGAQFEPGQMITLPALDHEVRGEL